MEATDAAEEAQAASEDSDDSDDAPIVVRKKRKGEAGGQFVDREAVRPGSTCTAH